MTGIEVQIVSTCYRCRKTNTRKNGDPGLPPVGWVRFQLLSAGIDSILCPDCKLGVVAFLMSSGSERETAWFGGVE